MKALFDLNVVLDVVQKREPHYAASAAAIASIVERRATGLLSAHAVTTLHYVVGRHRSAAVADEAVSWLLRHFDIATVDRWVLLRAQALQWRDFEDAVVASAAESSLCDVIVTRNVRDFGGSKVLVLTPKEYLIPE